MCFFIEPTGIRKWKDFPGPAGSRLPILLYRRTDTNEQRWTTEHAPGLEFGPGAMFYIDIGDEEHLWLILPTGHYIDLDTNGRNREGIPPMITVTHSTTPVVWTLEHGIFEADQCKLELYLRGTRQDRSTMQVEQSTHSQVD